MGVYDVQTSRGYDAVEGTGFFEELRYSRNVASARQEMGWRRRGVLRHASDNEVFQVSVRCEARERERAWLCSGS